MLMIPDKRLALQAYEQVLDLIMSGQLRPGTLLQERRLAEHLGISRTPLRDAMLILEGEGLLIRQESRGLQVRSLDVEDFIENLSIRRLLESEAARLAIGRIPEALLEDMVQRLEALLLEASEGETMPDRDMVRALDNDLHKAISSAAGNRQMSSIILSLRRQTQMFDLRSVPERLGDTCREHLAIIAALLAKRGDLAAEAMIVHLDAVRKSIINRLAAI